MIKYFLNCQSNHWPARIKKVDNIVKKILYFEKELNFVSNINYDCNIILTNDTSIQKLNYSYRKRNKPTDVLTFVSQVNLNNNTKRKICDVFISAETSKKDAENNNINYYNHLTHILIHSFLHINGYMHSKINDFNKMKSIEIKILNKMGIRNPYLAY